MIEPLTERIIDIDMRKLIDSNRLEYYIRYPMSLKQLFRKN